MKTRSFFHRHCHSSIPLRAAVTLAALVGLAWSSPAFCDEIHDAAKNGDLAKVQALLKDHPDLVFSKDNSGATPLHAAAQSGHKDIAELLLANKADVDAKANEGGTPLHYAAVSGHKDVVELLLAHGAEVSAKANHGNTPLHYAAYKGHKDVVELLLAKGADVNAKDISGETPLHRAAVNGHKDVAELLLANGADVNAKDINGETPLLPFPPDIDCSFQGLLLAESGNVWVAKSVTGLSCSMRGLAGTKDVALVSKTLTNGTASTRDFGEITTTVHGVPPGGGIIPPAAGSNFPGGRVTEVDYSLARPKPGLVDIMLHEDQVSALRAYLSTPTPFEASVTSCSGRVAAAWPPDVRFKKAETIWRIVDLANCSVYYAQLINLGIHARTGLMNTFDGAVTLTPDPREHRRTGLMMTADGRLTLTPDPREHRAAAHVTSIDEWKVPFSIPGVKSELHGEFTGGFALLGNPDGTVRREQPELHGGQGYKDVSFKDLRSKKKISFPRFVADTVGSDEAAAPPLKD